MQYKQLQLILEPTSIEELYRQDADNETLAETMLLNWELTGSLLSEEDYWRCLIELPEYFIFDNHITDFDTYKGIFWYELIIKVKNRYFAYYYCESMYDSDILNWKEVYPYPIIKYEIGYSKEKRKNTKNIYNKHFKELFERKK